MLERGAVTPFIVVPFVQATGFFRRKLNTVNITEIYSDDYAFLDLRHVSVINVPS